MFVCVCMCVLLIVQTFEELDNSNLEIAVFQRPSSVFDFASILVWLMAVMTVTAGSIYNMIFCEMI
jgi:hypothetical protein